MSKQNAIPKQLQDLILNGGQKKTAPAKDTSLKLIPAEPLLQVIHESKLFYKGQTASYYVLGAMPMETSTLDITLLVEEQGKRTRYKLDLYEKAQIIQTSSDIAEDHHLNEQLVESDLNQLTDLLEKHRDNLLIEQQQVKAQKKATGQDVKPQRQKELIEFLSKPSLIQRTDNLLEQAGIIGQEKIRFMFYLTALSYKGDTPLHLVLKGNPNAVKTIINTLGKCLPEGDTIRLNNVSAKLFYHCTGKQLLNKIVLLPHSLDKKAQQALTQLQEEETLYTASTVKDKLGNMVPALKQVQSHFSTLMYSPRSNGQHNALTISIDESPEQIQREIAYNKQLLSGQLDHASQQRARTFLQDLIQTLQSVQVINPLANTMQLPAQATSNLQANEQYNNLIKQITFLHQYQRKRDERGRIITQKEDIEHATQLFLALQEHDELESQVRTFYGQIEHYLESQMKTTFTMRELRQYYDLSKTTSFEYMQELIKLDYVTRTGNPNKGFIYQLIDLKNETGVRKSPQKQANTGTHAQQGKEASVRWRSESLANTRTHASLSKEASVRNNVKCTGSDEKTNC